MASRILWFGIGFAAGSTYASRLVTKERLDLPPGTDTTYHPQRIKVERKESAKAKIARMLEERSVQLSDVICQQGNRLSELVYQRGQALAGKLRGQGQEQRQAPSGDVLMPEVAGTYPAYGSPSAAQEQMAATYGTGADYGLEENR